MSKLTLGQYKSLAAPKASRRPVRVRSPGPVRCKI